MNPVSGEQGGEPVEKNPPLMNRVNPSMPQPLVWHWARVLMVIVVLLTVIGGVTWAGWNYAGREYYANAKLKSAEDAFNKNNINDAIRQAASVVESDPKNVKALIQLSLFLSQKGSLEFKEKEFGTKAALVAEQAIKLDQKNSEAWRARGYSQEIQQKYIVAHKDYATSLIYNKTNILTLYDDAHTYDLEGKVGEAEQGYRLVIASDASFPSAHAGLGRILVGKKDLEGALAEFTSVYTQTKNLHDKAEASYDIAMIHMSKREFMDAEKFSAEATVLDPYFALGWYGVGALYFAEATDFESKATLAERSALLAKSTTLMNDAIRLNPNQSAAYLQLAINFSLRGDFLTSMSVLDKAQQVVTSDITLSNTDKLAMFKRIRDVRESIGQLAKKAPTKK